MGFKDLEKWIDYDYPVSDSYGRKMVHDGGFFEVMVMCWKPGDYSAIHDHGEAEFGVVKVFGDTEHAAFKIVNQKLITLGRTIIEAGTTLEVAPALIHQMGNPGDRNFFSLHIYVNQATEGGITRDSRIYDYSRNAILRVDGGAFYLLPESEIKAREPLPEADSSTRQRDLKEAGKRAKAMKCGPEYKRILNEAPPTLVEPPLIQ
uniref:Cysteine dioxygenase type I family n=1 Tax=uncultured marine group II/III euryarchaeote KM3_191_F05 TaxID=1457962 RepID=A0A075GRH4_9EURY|nr:cysteine dioxygenase type I family [uncultured marine group II/III euryarchaeote KM3_191_F05]